MNTLPDHWTSNSWEEKARENPLYAVMTTPEFAGAASDQFSDAQLADFFAKGRAIFDAHIRPLAPAPCMLFEYGCGMGRIMKAGMDAGHAVAGADIAPTMVSHARRLLGEAPALVTVAQDGSVPLPSASFDVAYSYAVLQHISSLAAYLKAVSEIARLVIPGGKLLLHLNCEDLATDPPGRTENFETYSRHMLANGKSFDHPQTEWSGVYIGYDLLVTTLSEHGCRIERRYPLKAKKPRSIVFLGVKA